MKNPDEGLPLVAKVDADDLGLLLFCAMSPDRYLPPGRSLTTKYWESLPQKWRDIINNGGIATPWKDRRLEENEAVRMLRDGSGHGRPARSQPDDAGPGDAADNV